MQLSVIILNYKVPFYLLQCIQSVEKAIQRLDAEIIVVDNNSEDESCTLVRKHFPNVSLIQNKENVGFSKGNNQGALLARGTYICLLNPDTVVGETVFEDLLHFGKEHTDFGAIGPKLIDGTGNFLPESKRNIPTPSVALQKLLNISSAYYAQLSENDTGKTQILAGAFMLMKKSRYEEVGGLDEDYFMYGEDIDLSYKLLKAGYQNYYVGTSTVLHYKGESTVKNETYRKHFFGAMQLFYQKHFYKHKLYSLLVKSILNCAKVMHLFLSTQKKSISTNKFSAGFVIGNFSTDTLKKLEKYCCVAINSISSENVLKIEEEGSLVIFNAENINFQKIFVIMEHLKKHKNYFRIQPINLNFIVGSDHSDSKGEVIEFDKL